MNKILSLPVFLLLFLSSTSSFSQQVEHLVFEGAGIRGIAYCGALMELEERQQLSKVHTVAGTSSGAITACFYSVGFTPSEIADVVGDTDFKKFNDGKYAFIGGLYRLKHDLGWYPGNALLHWLEDHIESKTGNKDITFAQLKALSSANKSFRQLVVAATSINHQCSIYFSAETYPDMRIADAVHASMAVPLYFSPVIIDSLGHIVNQRDMTDADHLCSDGGFTANFLIDYFDDQSPESTLGLRIDSDEQILLDKGERSLAAQKTGTVAEYLQALFYFVKETMNRTQLTESDWKRTASISDCEIGPKVKRLSEEQKQQLIMAGRKGISNHFDPPK